MSVYEDLEAAQAELRNLRSEIPVGLAAVAEVERLRSLLRQRDSAIETLTAQRDAANDEANRLTGVDKWGAQDGPRPARDSAAGLLGPRIRWDNPPVPGATGSVPH